MGIFLIFRLSLFTPTFSGRQLGRKTSATRSSERSSEGSNTNFPAKNRIWTFRSANRHFTRRRRVTFYLTQLNIQIF